MAMYANVVASSKYASQRTEEPFEVRLFDSIDAYCWAGNENKYRTEDLEFFVLRKGKYSPSGLLSFSDQLVQRGLEEYLFNVRRLANSRDLGERDVAFRLRRSRIAELLAEISESYPKDRPTCSKCSMDVERCACD